MKMHEILVGLKFPELNQEPLELRAELLERGVLLEDGAGGTTWRLKKD